METALLPVRPLTAPAPAPLGSDRARMQEKATEFEAFFLTQVINLMKPEHEPSEFHGGVGERMFREELNVQLGKKLAESGGFGIADSVYAAMIQAQEGSTQGRRP